MDEIQQPSQKEKKYSTSTIIITSVVIIIILFLAFLLYYYSVTPISVSLNGPSPATKKVSVPVTPPAPKIIPTDVVIFVPPNPLPTSQKIGNCFASSIAAPFRPDAFRCMVANAIYDPCFTVAQKGFVYCQVGINNSTGFLMKLTQALPKVSAPATPQYNWAWFLTLKDGTQCSPFTGTRPIFSPTQIAYYGCNSSTPDKQVVLLGDLITGDVWTANEAVFTKNGNSWAIQSTNQVDIDTIWQ